MVCIIYQKIWYIIQIEDLFGKISNMKQIKFSENLKNLRLSAKMTQRQLAGILGVKQSTVSVWEKGTREPDFLLLAKICEIFDESFDDILT